MNPVRVLYVHNTADLYGASRSLLRLIGQMRVRGFDSVVVLPLDGVLRERIAEVGGKVIIDPWLSVIDRVTFRSPARTARFLLGFPISVWRLRRVLRQERVTLAHTNTGVLPGLALAAMLAGVPHVWHIRDSFHEFGFLWSIYRRYITTLSKRVLCISRFVAEQFPGSKKALVIHNAMPLEEFPENLDELRRGFREKYRLGDSLVVGCVGRIKFFRKGQEVLVQAASLLKRRGVTAKYVIVGSVAPGNEDHLTRLQQLIGELNLSSDVLLIGEVVDPKPAYAAMDVSVMPSADPEPLGGVVLESMAMRRPVVTTALGGPLDMVVDGETGFLVPPADPEALAEKLALLLADAALRKRMGDAGRAKLEREFAIQPMADKVEALYREVLRA